MDDVSSTSNVGSAWLRRWHCLIARLRAVGQVLLSGNPTALKRLAVAVLAVQSALSGIAAATLLMLHGDGAYFVYALSAGVPWALKWRDIADRATVWLLTVEPTALLSQSLALGPLAIAAVNGLVFYAVPALLFAVAVALVWRSHPRYLVFPLVTYVFGTSLGYGFPSEILLAPGFLWIAAFLVLKGRIGIGFVAAMAGLLFSHELAVPSALVVGYLALAQLAVDGRTRRLLLVGGVLAGLFVTLVVVMTQGGANGSAGNFLSIFDPRRIMYCPTLWLVVMMSCIVPALARYKPGLLPAAMVGALLAAPLLAMVLPDINFEQGRYDSIRSVVAALMFFLSLVFAAGLTPQPASVEPFKPVAAVLAVALAASLSAAAVFVGEWRDTLTVVTRLSTTGHDRTVDLAQPGPALTMQETQLILRMYFTWTLPFESAVLADGAVPATILYDSRYDYKFYCLQAGLIDPIRSRISQPALTAMRNLACAHQRGPIETRRTRFFRAIKQWLSR
jgi:hypothetical protein